MKRLLSDGAKKAIIVVRETITPFAKKVLIALPPSIVVEQFQEVCLKLSVESYFCNSFWLTQNQCCASLHLKALGKMSLLVCSRTAITMCRVGGGTS
jgi:hypothetical protein